MSAFDAPIRTAFLDNSIPFQFTKPSSSSSSSSVGGDTPIVIDNGSYELRAGYAIDDNPRLKVRAAIVKARNRKGGDYDRVGEYLSPEDWDKDRHRSPFEANVVCNFVNMECMLDYTFAKLDITSEGVDHPIVMTEALCNPNYSRAQMNELLFENYSVPSVAFGVDDLFSYSLNSGLEYGLIVGLGFEVSHVIPIVCGVPLLSESCRISIGGSHISNNLLSSLQLHNPHHSSVLYTPRAEEIVHRFCYVSNDFATELEAFADRTDPAITIQLPYEVNRVKQMTPEQILEKEKKQKEHGIRLKQMAEARRMEKLEHQKGLLKNYEDLLDERNTGAITSKQFISRILKGGFSDEADFMSIYKDLKKKVTAQLQRLGEEETGPEQDSTPNEQYPLLNVPDEELDETQRKEKRKQRLLKAGAEARERKRAEKEAIAAEEAERKRLQKERFEKDPKTFIAELRSRRQDTIERRAKRRKLKAELSDRRSAASKRRMRVLAEMGTGSMEGSSFGADDADWDVYRQVSKPGNKAADSDSEAELEEMRSLSELLQEYDPTAEEAMRESISSVAEHHQLYLSVQRIRQSELLFQPSMIGIDQTGIAETIRVVLSRLEPSVQEKVSQNVLVTGGPANLKGMAERIEQELIQIRPWQSKVHVRCASNVSDDAWKGAKAFAASNESLRAFSVSKSEYQEYGAEYFKHHRFGNAHIARQV